VATLGRLASVIARHDPRMVIALGDSFHDRSAHDRLSTTDREALAALQARRDWIWISGNHDPALPSDLGGVVAEEVAIGPIAFRHEPSGASGEIAGHLHPKARVSTRGRSMERRCFACDGERAVMPAFGAYAGGLSIRDAAFAKIFQSLGFMAHVLGDVRLHTIAASRCY
jgi:DNA ligase-associated metallophosphoesterase